MIQHEFWNRNLVQMHPQWSHKWLSVSSTQGKKKKPYMCALCSKAFSKAISLQNHMTSFHGYEEEESEEEDEGESQIISSGASTVDHTTDSTTASIQISVGPCTNDAEKEPSAGRFGNLLDVPSNREC